ncbi:MAG: Gx transporter family protein [Firmicutes bacterium]|nr:Gx transporter family protein [Bacillota bacterium]
MKSKAKRAAVLGLLAASAAVISVVESMLPALSFMPPGFKLGLSNIITAYCAVSLSLPSAIFIVFFKSLITLLFRGGMSAAMGLAGGVLSAAVMHLISRSKRVGIFGVSMAGGVVHNIAQVIVALGLIGQAALFYLPVLIPLGAVCGAATALLLRLAAPQIDKLFSGGKP